MNGQASFLGELVALLEQCDVAYMVSGSVASSFYGEPRATRDVDLVIDCDAQSLRRFADEVEHRRWYISTEAALAALRQRSMFNVIDPDSGWKADLIVRKDRAYSIREFERRSPQRIFGDTRAVPTVSAEDAILSKLEWCRSAGHEQQFKDATGIARVEGQALDWEYLEHWSQAIGLGDLLERLRGEIAGI